MKGLKRLVQRSTDMELVNALCNCRRELNRIFETECYEDPRIDDFGEIELEVMEEMSKRFSKRCLEMAR